MAIYYYFHHFPSQGGHSTKSIELRELNYMVRFIHWRRNVNKTWIYRILQLMLETSLHVN